MTNKELQKKILKINKQNKMRILINNKEYDILDVYADLEKIFIIPKEIKE